MIDYMYFSYRLYHQMKEKSFMIVKFQFLKCELCDIMKIYSIEPILVKFT